MNGALTVGTHDGATNLFLFGLTAQQVADSRGLRINCCMVGMRRFHLTGCGTSAPCAETSRRGASTSGPRLPYQRIQPVPLARFPRILVRKCPLLDDDSV